MTAFHRVLAALCLAVLALAPPAAAEEQILSFDSAVVVLADGVLDVTETIRVRAEGDQIKRGIYRDFPLTFRDAYDRRRRVSFDLVSVKRDGRPEPHHTAANSNGIRIYLGEESVFLDPGVYTYEIRYRTGRQLRFLPEHTELFWNVTGNEWTFPILRATARVALPGGGAPLRWTAYTGPFRARGTDFTGQILGDNALQVVITRPLAPGEGLSVVLQLPADLIAPPSGRAAGYYWFLDNRRFVLGGLGFAGVLAFYLLTWHAVGRDPPKGTVIPLFHPPQGISPALAAYVHDWGWRDRWRSFTAAALSLAVKGLIVFDDSEGTIVLTRRAGAAAPADLPPGERAIFNWVDGRGSVRIDKANGSSLAGTLSTFQSSIENENRNRFFRRNAGYFTIGIALTIGALFLTLIFGDLSDGEIGLMIGVIMASIFAGVFLVPLIRAVLGLRNARTTIAAAINIAVLVMFAFAAFTIVGPTFRDLPDDFGRSLFATFLDNGFSFALVGGFALMNGVFFYLLRAPTAAGRPVMDQIAGLDLYIRTAETPRLNAVGAPELTADQFERLLPYAIALDAEQPWSEAFARAFARAHPGQDVGSFYQPAWHGNRGWQGRDFSHSMSSAVSAATASFASAVPAPKSSSSGFSSGGGGSGGGGGGGGGGGW